MCCWANLPYKSSQTSSHGEQFSFHVEPCPCPSWVLINPYLWVESAYPGWRSLTEVKSRISFFGVACCSAKLYHVLWFGPAIRHMLAPSVAGVAHASWICSRPGTLQTPEGANLLRTLGVAGRLRSHSLNWTLWLLCLPGHAGLYASWESAFDRQTSQVGHVFGSSTLEGRYGWGPCLPSLAMAISHMMGA